MLYTPTIIYTVTIVYVGSRPLWPLVLCHTAPFWLCTGDT